MSYPPERHLLRDLRVWTERDGDAARTGMPLVPQLRGASGDVQAGALATLVDIAGGELAARSARPDWIATSDLVLHRLRRAEGAELVARPAVVRRSRQTVVLEVALEDGASGAREDDAPGALALATMSFAVVPAREAQRALAAGGAPPRTEFALPGSGLGSPLAETLGARCLDRASGRFELALGPYTVNSLGALQGGVAALLVDLAAEAAAGAALGSRCETMDLALNYLSLARESPVRTSTRVLRAGAFGALVRVETRDASGRLGLVASVGVARV